MIFIKFGRAELARRSALKDGAGLRKKMDEKKKRRMQGKRKMQCWGFRGWRAAQPSS